MTEYIISRTDLSAIQRTKIDLYGGVELVRCKDCKHFIHYCRVVEGKTTHNACALKEDGISKWRTTENDFCSWAERIDTAQVISDTDNGIDVTKYASSEDMWKDLVERKEE